VRRASILAVLAENPAGIAPTTLATRLGCSPTTLHHDLRQLRQEGHTIGLANDRLTLDHDVGWGPATLHWRLPRPVAYLPTCASTNRIARDLASTVALGAPLPVVVADHQTAGRGRRGRTWDAQPGQNLLFSVLLRPNLPAARIPRAVLAWAAAMATVLDVSLKWPNDLVVLRNDRIFKLGGILAELEPGPPTGRRTHAHPTVILGVGINVGQTTFDDLPQATSLAALGRPTPDRARLLARLITAIDAVDVHAPTLLDPWRRRACMLGRTVQVGDRTGIATGIRDDGALLIDGHPILTGDVALVADHTASPATTG